MSITKYNPLLSEQIQEVSDVDKEYVDNRTATIHDTFSNLPLIGETNLFYFTKDTSMTYYWNGFSYIPINSNISSGSLTNNLGNWDAANNIPEIINGTGEQGDFYVVSVMGNTDIDGINIWGIGDYIWFDYSSSIWRKIDNQNNIQHNTSIEYNVHDESEFQVAYTEIFNNYNGGLIKLAQNITLTKNHIFNHNNIEIEGSGNSIIMNGRSITNTGYFCNYINVNFVDTSSSKFIFTDTSNTSTAYKFYNCGFFNFLDNGNKIVFDFANVHASIYLSLKDCVFSGNSSTSLYTAQISVSSYNTHATAYITTNRAFRELYNTIKYGFVGSLPDSGSGMLNYVYDGTSSVVTSIGYLIPTGIYNLIKPPLSNGKTWIGDTNNFPIEKDYYQIQYFDATVGTGGDYNTIYDALVAGKHNLKLISNITETTTFELTSGTILKIDLNSYTLRYSNCSINTIVTFPFVYITGKGTVISNQTDVGRTLCNCFVEFNNVNIINSSTIANSPITTSKTVNLYNCTLALPNLALCGLGTNNNYTGTIFNLTITGGGINADKIINETVANTGNIQNILSTCRGTIVLSSTANSHINIYQNEVNSNIIFTQNAKAIMVYTTGGLRVDGNVYLSNFRCNTIIGLQSDAIFSDGIITSAVSLSTYNNWTFTNVKFLSNLTISSDNNTITDSTISGNLTIEATADSTIVSNTRVTGTATISGNYIKLLYCDLMNTLTINGDNNKLNNNTVVGATTLAAGSEYNIITDNHLSGGLVNNSGNLTNEINNNI